MTLAEFDTMEKLLEDLVIKADEIRRDAKVGIDKFYKSLGIFYKDRGPGFNKWSHKEIESWEACPHNVYAELLKVRMEHKRSQEMLGSGI